MFKHLKSKTALVKDGDGENDEGPTPGLPPKKNGRQRKLTKALNI